MKHYNMYINGEWFNTRNVLEVENPATKEIIASVPNGGSDEAKIAVNAAHAAFSTWSKTTAYERSEYLKNWFTLIEQNQEEIAKTMTMEQGKPLKEALSEVQYANSFLSWYAEEAKRVYGETIPASHSHKRLLIQKQPVGVVAAITPWNFPAAMITRKVAPALAAGCTVVVKPAESTPLTALLLANFAHEAGIPKGVINVVTGDPKEIGNVWLDDPRVKKITFTGSTEVGKYLMRRAADTVKKVSLELGGHAPFIVMSDANIKKAVEGVIQSKFRNAGQTCICTNRIYVQEGIAASFIQEFAAAAALLKVGSGFEEGTDIGPLINYNAIEKVKSHISDAVDKGAEVLVGGNQLVAKNGYYFEPTLLSGVTDEMDCMKEETFGPLAPITTFKTEEEVIERANNSPYGLAAYVYTENLGCSIRVSEGLEFGIVGVNDSIPSVSQAPFGGLKESGLGREGGHYGIEEFLEVKYISIGI